MSQATDLIQKVRRHGAHNYHPLDVVLTKGLGSKVWDVEGKEYLDFLSCYSALNFGHQHSAIMAALEKQVHQLAVCSRAFFSEQLCLFSEELAKFTGLDSVLPMNSGAEAVESAIKVARKWGYQKKKIKDGRANIIVMENSFHGRTVTLVSFSTEEIYRNEFGPYTPGFHLASFGNIESITKLIDENTVGVLLEPIQAEAGILIPPVGYLKDVRELCTQKNILLMLDEIQTGLGRTGRNFCFQHEGIVPDMLILGKSLGGGLLPVSAVVARKEVMDVLRPGEHGSTFGGNPLGCAVARAAIALLRDGKLAERSQTLGRSAVDTLKKRKLARVKEIRAMGLLIGVELEVTAGGARKYCEALAHEGVLCKETHDHVIRIAPPLTILEKELKQGLETVMAIINKFK